MMRLTLHRKKGQLDILLLLLLLSCSGKEEIEIQSFPIDQQLKSEYIFEDLINVAAIHVIDTLILIERLQKTDAVYEVYSANSLEKIGNLGIEGDGPEEWRTPRHADQFYKKSSDLFMWINDIRHSRMHEINITKSISDSSVYLNQSLNYHPPHDFTQEILSLNDSTWVALRGPSTSALSRLIKFNPATEESSFLVQQPTIENKNLLSQQDLYKIYFSNIRMKPDGSLIVSSMYHFNRIDIFNSALSLELTVKEGKESQSMDAKDFLDSEYDLRIFYKDIYVTDKYIYALFYDQLDREYGVSIKPTSIRVFNWSGDPVANFKVSEYLTSFAIDEPSGYIYGTAYFEEKIVRYPFDVMK